MSLFDLLDLDLCGYGQPRAGDPRPCSEKATHRACWFIPGGSRAGSGGIDCCRDHANYYASAWCPLYPAETGSAWIDVLP